MFPFRVTLTHIILLGAITACGGEGVTPPQVPDTSPNRVSLVSEPGDYIGEGRSYNYTNVDAVLSPSATATLIQVHVAGTKDWDGRFAVDSGTTLGTKTYSNAIRWPILTSGPTMDWSGDGRGCTALTGSFTVDGLTWTAGFGSALQSLDLHFEQHCGGDKPALRGTIHWRADDPTLPAGPVTPIPATLWQPPTVALPVSGDYVYLVSDAGDVVGRGATTLFQSGIRADGSGNAVSVSLNTGSSSAYGAFQGMRSLANLKVGFYNNPVQNNLGSPLLPGMGWYDNSLGCTSATAGWFAIDRVNYANGVVAGIALRFEQRCNGSSAALHGAIRWGQLTG